MLKLRRIAIICSMFLLAITNNVFAGYDVDKVFKINVGFPWSMATPKVLFKLNTTTGKGALGLETYGSNAGNQLFTMKPGPTRVNFNFKTPRGSTITGFAIVNSEARTLYVNATIKSTFLPDKDFKDTFKF